MNLQRCRSKAEWGASAESVRPWVVGLVCGALFCLCARSAGAEPVDAERIVTEHLRGLGAVVDEPSARMFLQQGDSTVLAQSVQEGCVGFLAFGTGSVRDVDLSIHTKGGLLLDEDSSAAPYAYVRGCAGHPQTWFVNVSLYAGRGELMLVRVEQAPRSVGLLPFDLGLAAPSGGRPERPRPVGPALPPQDPEQRVVKEEERWAERGYTPGTALLRLPLDAGLGRATLPLERGLCYAIAVSGGASRHTAVVLAGPDGSRWSGADAASEAVVYACPRVTDEHAVFVRARPGGQSALLRAYVQAEAGRWKPDIRSADRARALVGELTHEFEQRGLASNVVGQAYVDTVSPLHWPVSMRAGHCYGLGAVAMSRVQRGIVELALEAPDGHLLSRHRRREGPPYIFHCAKQSGVHRLVIRATGEVGRIAVVRGQRALTDSRRAHARR